MEPTNAVLCHGGMIVPTKSKALHRSRKTTGGLSEFSIARNAPAADDAVLNQNSNLVVRRQVMPSRGL